MKIQFYGSQTAELFSKELSESLDGVIKHLMVTDETDPNVGCIVASMPGYFWCDTMWTRDAGTLLRELVFWGRLHEAGLLTKALLRLVDKNEDGYYMFPEYFEKGQKKAGTELDGTASILIGMVHLYRHLDKKDALRKLIREFLLSPDASVAYILREVDKSELLAGSGEFGGGCFIEGEYVNVVQNNLIALSLIAVSDLLKQLGEDDTAKACSQAVEKIEKGISKYLIDEDGYLIWCVEPDTMLPNEAILNERINRGTGLINGVLSMTADAIGMSLGDKFYAYDASVRTFHRLHETPLRKELFDKYGMWMQFDDWVPGFTSASYGQGYALQCMLLMDRLDLAEKALNYLAKETFSPIEGYNLKRESPYYFYERYYTPYSVEQKADLAEGCGALNVVNVAEPLKIARMIAGIDMVGDVPKLLPRFPKGIDGFEATEVKFVFGDNIYMGNISCSKENENYHFNIEIVDGVLPKMVISTNNGSRIFENIQNLDVTM